MITQISQITEMTLDNILQNFFFQFQTTFSYFVNCCRKTTTFTAIFDYIDALTAGKFHENQRELASKTKIPLFS